MMCVKAREVNGNLVIEVSDTAVCRAIQREFGLSPDAYLDDVFGTEGAAALVKVVHRRIVEAVEDRLADITPEWADARKKKAAAGGEATAH